MGYGSRRGRIVTAVLALALVGTGWFLLAPQRFGGSTAYVIVGGSSMEPGIHDGDLVLLRADENYRVGDVVGYRSPSLHTVVLHRIIEVDGERFAFKGDSNSWIDPDRPSSSDLLGSVWVRVPAVGALLRRPWVMFALVVVLLLGAFGGLGAGTTRRHRGRRGSLTRSLLRTPSLGTTDRAAAMSMGVALAAFTTLGGLAFATSEARETATQVPYTHSGSFTYATPVPAGPVYGTGGVATGDPVYLRLASDLDVTFGYTFRSDVVHRTSGRGQLFAVISDLNGWSRRSSLGPGTSFLGDEASITGRLDLAKIQRLLTRVERLTGVVRDQYEVHVLADMRLDVSTDTAIEHMAFIPRLAFQIDPFLLQLAPEGAAFDDAGGILHPTDGGSLEGRAVRPTTMSILGRPVDVRTARWVAVVGVIASFAALWIAFGVVRRRRREDEMTRIRRRHGQMLVPISGRMAPASHQIEVADMDTLVRLAEHHDRLVLQSRTETGDDFAVEHDGIRYHY